MAEWERARLYRVNRPPLDHVRLKKKKEEKEVKVKMVNRTENDSPKS